MKKLIFIISTTLLSLSGFSQISTDNFILELKKQKIDTIAVFKNYCVGCKFVIDEKNPEGFCNNFPEYLFWKKNGKTYLTKKDSCFEYSVVEINEFIV